MQCHVTLVLYAVEYLTKVWIKKKNNKENVPMTVRVCGPNIAPSLFRTSFFNVIV